MAEVENLARGGGWKSEGCRGRMSGWKGVKSKENSIPEKITNKNATL